MRIAGLACKEIPESPFTIPLAPFEDRVQPSTDATFIYREPAYTATIPPSAHKMLLCFIRDNVGRKLCCFIDVRTTKAYCCKVWCHPSWFHGTIFSGYGTEDWFYISDTLSYKGFSLKIDRFVSERLDYVVALVVDMKATQKRNPNLTILNYTTNYFIDECDVLASLKTGTLLVSGIKHYRA